MSTPDNRPVVAYVLRKFPKLSEMFILNEILGLEAAGVKVHIFSLMPPTDPRFHDDLSRLKAQVWYVPGFVESRDRRSLRRTNRDAARRFGADYRKTRRQALATGRPKMLWRFFQAGWIAERAARLRVGRFHAHFATRATTVARLASSISTRPYSFTAHAVDIYREDVDARILNRKIADASFVATVSESNMRHLSGVANGSGSKLVLLHNGIDMDKFAPNGGGRKPKLTFLSVARLVEKKGGEYLVEACRILAERNVSFSCEIVGRGNLRKPLLEKIRQAGLEDRVRLLGGRKQKDVLKRYHSTYLYVLPSIVGSDGNREALPVSIVEALACGVPVITTPTAGIPEVVKDEHNGLLVPEKDPVALADAMERLIEDRTLYERLRETARASVLQTFDTTRTSAKLRQLFVEAD
jgi:glycosyltransferase involved in cell wall biosynthesis